VRNDMYLSSEALRLFAKSKKPAFTGEEAAVMANYKKKLDYSNKVHSHLGQGRGCDRALWVRHYGWWKRIVVYGRREDR